MSEIPEYGTDTIEREVTVQINEGDHDKMSHYVRKEDLLEGLVSGVPIMALCGKIWIPTRDGSKFPVCQTCEELIKNLPPV